MPKPDLAGLRDDEWMISNMSVADYIHLMKTRLAASRASEARKKKLLWKHRYYHVFNHKEGDITCCVECKAFIPTLRYPTKYPVCKPDCLLAAELRGGGE